MSNCMRCNESLTHTEDTLECSVCNNNYHYYCIGISETNFKKMSKNTKNTKNRYSCAKCYNSETKTINDPLLKLNTKMEDLIKSVNFMGLQFDDFNNKLESILTELKHLKKEYESIKADNLRLSNEILEIKQKLDTFEQQNLGISVEINGVPKSNNENYIAVMQSIVKQLNITPRSPKQLELYYQITKSRL
uniref:PHD-type domain-containing protein n=1 Tax=Schizaphis graminum TaxID=13262 RepID=A0A2S2PQP8_SCHGA